MGITGLLPYVSKACRNGYINEFRGKTIAIDVSCLLHRGMIFQHKNGEVLPAVYVAYVRKYVELFRAINCHVVLVFDGRRLPAKKEVHDERRARRESNHKRAEELLAEGRVKEAHHHFQMSATITREVLETTIQAFQDTAHVDVIVAPYEADAQLAYLMQHNLVDAVYTEDSDLIVFGCETLGSIEVLYKVQDTGLCVIYQKSKLHECLPPPMAKNFDFSSFRRMCILSGCDYLQGGLEGIGLKGAQLFFTKMALMTNEKDPRKLLPRIHRALGKSKSKIKVTQEFVEDFIRAENTFLYQTVFDPIKRQQVPLNPFPAEESSMLLYSLREAGEDDDEKGEGNIPYVGKILHQSEAIRLALGNEEIRRSEFRATHATSKDLFAMPDVIPEWSIWSESYSLLRAVGMENLRQSTNKNGFTAFSVDDRKRRRRSVVVLEEEREEKEEVIELKANIIRSAPAVKRRRSEHLLVVRNGVPDESWTADDMLTLYAKDVEAREKTAQKKEENNSIETRRGGREEELRRSFHFTRRSSVALLLQKEGEEGESSPNLL